MSIYIYIKISFSSFIMNNFICLIRNKVKLYYKSEKKENTSKQNNEKSEKENNNNNNTEAKRSDQREEEEKFLFLHFGCPFLVIYVSLSLGVRANVIVCESASSRCMSVCVHLFSCSSPFSPLALSLSLAVWTCMCCERMRRAVYVFVAFIIGTIPIPANNCERCVTSSFAEK